MQATLLEVTPKTETNPTWVVDLCSKLLEPPHILLLLLLCALPYLPSRCRCHVTLYQPRHPRPIPSHMGPKKRLCMLPPPPPGIVTLFIPRTTTMFQLSVVSGSPSSPTAAIYIQWIYIHRLSCFVCCCCVDSFVLQTPSRLHLYLPLFSFSFAIRSLLSSFYDIAILGMNKSLAGQASL